MSSSKVSLYLEERLPTFHQAIKPLSQCLKITKNVAFEILAFWHLPPIFVLLKLTCLTLFDLTLQVLKKTRQNGPFLAFLINFYPLKM